MRGIYRISAVVLIFVLLFSMVSCDFGSLGGGGLVGELLGSFQENSDNDGETDEYLTDIDQMIGSSEEMDTQDITVEVDHWVSPYLPSNDVVRGEEIVILSNNMSNISPEEHSSDSLEDALFNRDDRIESTYGVELNCLLEEEYIPLGDLVKNDVASGTGEYHIVYQHMVDSTTNLALSDCLENLLNVNYVDFSQEWWDKDNLNGFKVGDQMLMASGDLLPNTMLLSSALFFNKALFDQQGWEYPYDDAKANTWTLDDMMALTRDQTRDLNGDARINYADDLYGLVGWSLDCDYAFAFGADMTMFEYDNNHLPVYNPKLDRLQSAYDKIYNLFITQNAFHVTVEEYIENNAMYQEPRNVFRSGRALFFASYLRDAIDLHDMENDFGILPMPKYNESQESYRTFVNGSASVVVVPKGLDAQKLDVVGYMMEVLASSSYYTVTDTLYEKVVKSKTIYDSESAEMVDIILCNKVFDFGYTYFDNEGVACASIVRISLGDNVTLIEKQITKDAKRTAKALKKIYEAYGYQYT